MRSPEPASPAPERWTSLWVAALISLLLQLWLCQFFSFGERVPLSLDTDPCNLWKYAYQVPPQGSFLVLNWLGLANLPPSLNPFSLGALLLSPWFFFTTYTPIIGTLALLAMAAFLRELELPRPAALFGGIVFAWQGDILPFIFPGHYMYIATWPFYALAMWGALRSQRTGYWAYALVSGASCGLMVALEPDRGAIASLLVAAFYLAGIGWRPARWRAGLGHLTLCAVVALGVSLASFLALFQSFIVGVSMGGTPNREETYKFDTQFSYGPEETLTYLVPGFFGWYTNSETGPYWGRIGQWPDWPLHHEGTRNSNLAISTTGTVAAVLAVLAISMLLPGRLTGLVGASDLSERQRWYGRVLVILGGVALVLAWGYHTPFYRAVFALPLMDKWRNPLKWLEMTNFALVTLSAFGVQHLLASVRSLGTLETRSLQRRIRWFFDGAFVLLFLGLLLSYPFTVEWAPVLLADDYPSEEVAAIMATVHTSMWVATALLLSTCLLLRVLWNPGRLQNWKLENPWLHRSWQAMLKPAHLPVTLALALALLSGIQLAWVATQFIRPTRLALLTGMDPLMQELASQGNQVRVTVAAEDPVLNALLQNQFNVPQISCLTISSASRIPDTLKAFFGDFGDDLARLWYLSGVKSLVIPQAVFPEVKRDPSLMANIDHVDGYVLGPTSSMDLPTHALVEFRDYMAKATFVPGAEYFPTLKAQLPRVKDPTWNPRETVLLVGAGGKSEPAPLAHGGTTQVNLTTYDSHRIDLKVVAPASGYLLINDAYDPDWKVTLNGQAAPLLCADFMLRAIAVPAGTSTIALRYVAHYHVGGLNLPAESLNLFCDSFMVLTWLVAGLCLYRKEPSG